MELTPLENILVLTGLAAISGIVIVVLMAFESWLSRLFRPRNEIVRRDKPCTIPGAEIFRAMRGGE